MNETYTELSTLFTTTDTEGPVQMRFDGATLVIEFANFRTPNQTVEFACTRAFAWSGWDETSPDISPDRVYEVRGSEFLAPWERFKVGKMPYRHFKLGFNAEAKYLDVVATTMELKESNQSPETRPTSRPVSA